jgi:hypothetical protein
VAFRVSGARRLPALFAAAGVLSVSGFADGVLAGESEGLLAAAALLAIALHVDGRHRQALGCAFAAALIRPETWVFFALYALWIWRRDRGAMSMVLVMGGLIGALWFVPDLVGSGSLTRGVHWAQFAKAGSPARAGCPFCAEITDHAWPLVAPPFKVGALLACALAVILHGRPRLALVAALSIGLAWVLEEAVFTQLGFSGSDRYLVAPVALLTVAGAAGWSAALAERRWFVCGLSLAATAVLALAGQWPGPHVARALDQVGYQQRLLAEVRRAVARAGGSRRLLACGPVQTNPSEVPLVAWTLRVPMRSAENSAGQVVLVSPNGPHAPAGPVVVGKDFRAVARAGAVTVLSRCQR